MSAKKPKAIDFFNSDELIFWSFRYFLGRQTIATVCFAERLARAWPHISDKNKSLIQYELEEAFRQEVELVGSAHGWKPLGDSCDREAWEKVRKAYGGGQ